MREFESLFFGRAVHVPEDYRAQHAQHDSGASLVTHRGLIFFDSALPNEEADHESDEGGQEDQMGLIVALLMHLMNGIV